MGQKFDTNTLGKGVEWTARQINGTLGKQIESKLQLRFDPRTRSVSGCPPMQGVM